MKSLLCVHGLLPITFRGASYNIPIACWLPLDYPKEVPLAYVVPTGDMLVRSSPEVDVSGLCRFEYLARWSAKPEVRSQLALIVIPRLIPANKAFSLRGLLEEMQERFSHQPPVYSKPKSPPIEAPSPRPPPPPPNTQSAIPNGPWAASPSFQQVNGSDPTRPPLPPKVPLNAYYGSPVSSPSPGPSHARHVSLVSSHPNLNASLTRLNFGLSS